MSMKLPVAAWSEFSQLWSGSAATVLGQISGKQFQGSAQVFPSAPPADDSDEATLSRWFLISIEKSLAGEFALHVEMPSAVGMAQLLMADAFDPAAEFSADYEDALAELVRQFCGSLAVALKSVQGEEIPVRLKEMARPAWEPVGFVEIDLTAAEGETVHMRVLVGTELSDSLAASHLAPAPKKATKPVESTSSPAPVQDANKADTGTHSNQQAIDLGMLREISLNARLSFGDHTMALTDVLGCVPGSVVESDRPPEMPVELWVEGILAARGDIVIVDGNYGVRVRELCHSESRKSSLSKGTVLSV